ncbi:MAG: DUF4097 family beta strand repeat-containing protein [Blastocatellia bacterium]
MKHVLFAVSTFAVVLIASATASAQDFQKSYPASAGTSVAISTMSGDIKITTHGGSDVVVTGRITGDDADKVRIEDRSAGGRIDVDVDYPKHGNTNASVDFDVQVPAGVRLRLDRIRTMSGDIEITGVSATVEATTMSGNVRVMNTTGVVQAKTMSGNVVVEIDALEGESDLSFVSMSGDVDIRLPSNAGATVSIKTLSGNIENDFGLSVVTKKHGPGQSLDGTIGDGTRRLFAKSMSGDVRLRRQ